MKKIGNISLIAALLVAAVAGVGATLLHVRRQADKVLCTNIRVVIADSSVNRFVRKEDIPAIFRRSGLTYFGKKVSEISTREMEKALTERSLIRQANVYTTADGTLHVTVVQRKPIVRVYTDNGQSFYIDDEGFIIRPYSGYTSNVPIASGRITAPFESSFRGSMFAFFEEKKKSDALLRQLYAFASYLNENVFWQAQVEQLYITAQGKVELVPRVGANIIHLGSFENFEYKLHKLEAMYEKGMSLKGWNAYEVIDLSFGNQVVCRKKLITKS
ncbi:MAG: cell division protein FtsQ/DivIB [Prevotellaceae bacterium]|jgi:cell division protein FtsQ|nr:cell division protein FtsQ/DivIB [Prevotellaceae bacterium]